MDESDYDGDEAFAGLGEDWEVIERVLPDRWQESARHAGALTRMRSTLEGLIKLAKALHVSLNELVFDADEPGPAAIAVAVRCHRAARLEGAGRDPGTAGGHDRQTRSPALDCGRLNTRAFLFSIKRFKPPALAGEL